MGLFKLSLAALLSEGTDSAPKNPPGRRCALACHLISLFFSQPSSGAGVCVCATVLFTNGIAFAFRTRRSGPRDLRPTCFHVQFFCSEQWNRGEEKMLKQCVRYGLNLTGGMSSVSQHSTQGLVALYFRVTFTAINTPLNLWFFQTVVD